jgi:hypothetical protein
METEEDISAGYLGAHLTHYTLDANLPDARRAEARRVLALECALCLPGNEKTVIKRAKEIETFLRGTPDLRTVPD